MLNEFFNELAYNPGANQAGFLFYLDWFNHNATSLFANTDANGPIGHGLLYFACTQIYTLPGVAQVNPTARAVLGLIQPPAAAPGALGIAGKCPTPSGAGVSSASELAGRVFGKGLQSTFGINGGEGAPQPSGGVSPFSKSGAAG